MVCLRAKAASFTGKRVLIERKVPYGLPEGESCFIHRKELPIAQLSWCQQEDRRLTCNEQTNKKEFMLWLHQGDRGRPNTPGSSPNSLFNEYVSRLFYVPAGLFWRDCGAG